MSDVEYLRKVCVAYESKLKELMGEESFVDFSLQVSKELFAEEVQAMPDSEFKQTILGNFEAITGSEEDYNRWLRSFGAFDPGDCGADY